MAHIVHGRSLTLAVIAMAGALAPSSCRSAELEDLLMDLAIGEPGEKRAALKSILKTRDKEAIPGLIEAWEDEDLGEARPLIASFFTKFTDKRTTPMLVESLACVLAKNESFRLTKPTEQFVKTQSAILSALTRLKDPPAFEPMVEMLDPAHWGLEYLTTTIHGTLLLKIGAAREQLKQDLAGLGKPILPTIAPALYAPEAKPFAGELLEVVADIPAKESAVIAANCLGRAALRKAAIRTLEKLGPIAADALVKAMAHQDRDVRVQIPKLLGVTGTATSARRLLVALDDEDAAVRRQAARALRGTADAEVLARLRSLASGDDDRARLARLALQSGTPEEAKAFAELPKGFIFSVCPLVEEKLTLKQEGTPEQPKFVGELLHQPQEKTTALRWDGKPVRRSALTFQASGRKVTLTNLGRPHLDKLDVFNVRYRLQTQTCSMASFDGKLYVLDVPESGTPARAQIRCYRPSGELVASSPAWNGVAQPIALTADQAGLVMLCRAEEGGELSLRRLAPDTLAVLPTERFHLPLKLTSASDVSFDEDLGCYWLATGSGLHQYEPKTKAGKLVFKGKHLNGKIACYDGSVYVLAPVDARRKSSANTLIRVELDTGTVTNLTPPGYELGRSTYEGKIRINYDWHQVSVLFNGRHVGEWKNPTGGHALASLGGALWSISGHLDVVLMTRLDDGRPAPDGIRDRERKVETVDLPVEDVAAIRGAITNGKVVAVYPPGASELLVSEVKKACRAVGVTPVAGKLGYPANAWVCYRNPGLGLILIGRPEDNYLVHGLGARYYTVDQDWPGAGKGCIKFCAEPTVGRGETVLVSGGDEAGTIAALQHLAKTFGSYTKERPPFQVWAVDPMEYVFSWDRGLGRTVEKLSLQAGRAEREQATVVLRTSRPVPDLQVDASPLSGADGTIPAPRVRRGLWLARGNPIVVDPIDDGLPGELPAATTLQVWLTYTVPDATRPGKYTGSLDIAGAGRTLSIPIEMQVHDFVLPKERTLVRWRGQFPNLKFAQEYLGIRDAAEFEQEKVAEKYLANLAEHGINAMSLYGGALDWVVEPDGSVSASLGAAEKQMELAAKAGVNKAYVLGRFGMGSGAVRQSDGSLEPHREPVTGELRWRVADSLRRHLREKGWLGKVTCRVHDEPGSAAMYKVMSSWVEGTGLWRGDPMNRGDPAFREAMVGTIRSWIPAWFRFRDDFYAERRNAGDTIWCYSCHFPLPFNAHPQTETRIAFWDLWRRNIRGVYFYSLHSWYGLGISVSDEDYVKGVEPSPFDVVCAFGYTVFPDKKRHTLMDTVRWENMAEAGEDHVYLSLFEREALRAPARGRDASAQLAEVKRRCRVMTEGQFVNDIALLRESRALLTEYLADVRSDLRERWATGFDQQNGTLPDGLTIEGGAWVDHDADGAMRLDKGASVRIDELGPCVIEAKLKPHDFPSAVIRVSDATGERVAFSIDAVKLAATQGANASSLPYDFWRMGRPHWHWLSLTLSRGTVWLDIDNDSALAHVYDTKIDLKPPLRVTVESLEGNLLVDDVRVSGIVR